MACQSVWGGRRHPAHTVQRRRCCTFRIRVRRRKSDENAASFLRISELFANFVAPWRCVRRFVAVDAVQYPGRQMFAMSATITDLLSGITAKCDMLARRCRDLDEENRRLRASLAESRQAEEIARRDLDDARRKLNYQTIASNFDSGTRDSSRQSSRIISDMVRKIDRCISRLEAE